MQSLLMSLMVSLSLTPFGHAYSASAWGVLKNRILNNPGRVGAHCSSNKRFDHIFHVSKLSNVKSILASGKILPRAQVAHDPDQLFKGTDCNPNVVYTSFKPQQARAGKCIFQFPVSNFEDYLEDQDKVGEIFISGFYNLGRFDPNFSSDIENVDKFCSLLTLPGHELVIPCALNIKEGLSLISAPSDSGEIKDFPDEFGYNYIHKHLNEEDRFDLLLN